MSKTIPLILLIDDNTDDNYLHRHNIMKTELVERSEVCTDGKEALYFLKRTLDEPGSKAPLPDLIFLDINMPVMDGWEFLDEYSKLNISREAAPVIIMLSTSRNPDDLARSLRYDIIKDYKAKPLTQDMLREIVSKYFP